MSLDIRSMLIKHHLINSNDLIKIQIRAQGNWGVTVYAGREKYYQLKLGVINNLSDEYDNLNKIHNKYPKYVAKPLKLLKEDQFDILIMQGVEHSLFPREVCNLKKKHLFSIFDYFLDSDTTQHGDFTANNLGWVKDKLVIFDWEDYGIIQEVGFDFFTLFASMCNFDMKKLISFWSNQFEIVYFLNYWLGSYNLNYELYLRKIPHLLMEFKKLKINLGYSQEIIQRVTSAMIQIEVGENA